jgi:Sec-independent protein secretion pathway component TatC
MYFKEIMYRCSYIFLNFLLFFFLILYYYQDFLTIVINPLMSKGIAFYLVYTSPNEILYINIYIAFLFSCFFTLLVAFTQVYLYILPSVYKFEAKYTLFFLLFNILNIYIFTYFFINLLFPKIWFLFLKLENNIFKTHIDLFLENKLLDFLHFFIYAYILTYIIYNITYVLFYFKSMIPRRIFYLLIIILFNIIIPIELYTQCIIYIYFFFFYEIHFFFNQYIINLKKLTL